MASVHLFSILFIIACCNLSRISCEDLTETQLNNVKTSERVKRAGLGLLQRLEKKKIPETCEDTPCARGYEFHTECNKTMDKKTLCVPCRYQFYKDEKSFDKCRPCSVCAPGQVVSRWCTTKRNTMCSGDYQPPKPVKEYKLHKKKKSVVPNYIITLVVPAALLLLVLGGSLAIYIRIKLKPKEKGSDKDPLTTSCVYEEAAPIPVKTPPPDTPLTVHPYSGRFDSNAQNLSPAISARDKIQPLSFGLPKELSEGQRRVYKTQSLGTISGSISKI